MFFSLEMRIDCILYVFLVQHVHRESYQTGATLNLLGFEKTNSIAWQLMNASFESSDFILRMKRIYLL